MEKIKGVLRKVTNEDLQNIEKLFAKVTEIGNGAFSNCDQLCEIQLPYSISKIHDAAFWNCKNLDFAFIPDSVTEIGSCCFAGCSSLGSVKLPTSLMSIGDMAFAACPRLKYIDFYKFDCGIQDVLSMRIEVFREFQKYEEERIAKEGEDCFFGLRRDSFPIIDRVLIWTMTEKAAKGNPEMQAKFFEGVDALLAEQEIDDCLKETYDRMRKEIEDEANRDK